MWGCEPACWGRHRPAEPWRPRAPSAWPCSRRRRAGNVDRGRPALSLSALRWDYDGTAGRALRPAALLGIGNWPGVLPVRADGVVHRRNARAGVHLAVGIRPEAMDDPAQLGGGRGRRQAAASRCRVAPVAVWLFAATAGGTRRRVSLRPGSPRLGHARRAGVRGGCARCMRATRITRARSPPPPSRVVSSRAGRKASHGPRCPALPQRGGARSFDVDERSQPKESRRGDRAVSQ